MTSPWLTDPSLSGQFHPNFADDLRVVVHDGEPRRTKRMPEIAWVRVTGIHRALQMPTASELRTKPLDTSELAWVERPVYAGTLLNQPTGLETARQGQSLLFLHTPGVPHPLRVTEQYVTERARWAVSACDKCGADQTLDPPSIMAKTRFPNTPAGSTPISFTAFCVCGGTMVLSSVNHAAAQAK
jgi:hypothetical protein